MAKVKIQEKQSLLLPIFAIISVIIFIALCWYAYNNFIIGSKKNGAVYIKADKSPIKIKPTDPGGMQVDHTDKQIFNTINGTDESEKQEVKIIKEEEPINKIKYVSDNNPRTLDSLIEESYKGEEILSKAAANKELDIEDAEQKPNDSVKKIETSKTENGKNKTTIIFKNVKKPSYAGSSKNNKPSTSNSGNYFVQIGAYGSNAEAKSSWQKYSNRLGSLINSYKYRIDKAVVKGKAYHRLSFGGFQSKSEAAKKCVSLKSKAVNCLVKKY